MSIIIDSAKIKHISTIYGDMRSGKTSENRQAGQSFDSIMIQPNSREAAENRITENFQKQVTAEVFTKKADTARIEALKEQVRSGNYIPNPGEIAAKMLFMKGEE